MWDLIFGFFSPVRVLFAHLNIIHIDGFLHVFLLQGIKVNSSSTMFSIELMTLLYIST